MTTPHVDARDGIETKGQNAITEPHISDEQLASHIEHIRHYGLDTHGLTFLSRGYVFDLRDARAEIARLKVEIKTVRARALEEAAERIEHCRVTSNSDEFEKGWNRALAVAITIIRNAAITEPTT